MSRPHRQSSWLKNTGLVAGGVFTATAALTVSLTDSRIWSSMWPAGFHRLLIERLGGDPGMDVAGGSRTQLSGLLVLSWLMGLLVVLSLLSAVTASAGSMARRRWPSRTSDGGKPRSFVTGVSVSQVFGRAAVRISRVWLGALVWFLLWLLADLFPGSDVATFVYLTPPFWLAVLSAATLCAAEPPGAADLPVAGHPAEAISGRWPLACLTGLMTVWIAVSFWMNERLYAGLWIPHGDSGMYEEHLWNVWHGKGFRSYLDQGLFLGEHLQVIHLLLLPLHMLWPSHLLLELAESLALGVCVIPIYSIARRHSGSAVAAAWLGAAWLLFYPMHFLDIAIDLKTLRPGCYGLPFLLWGIDLGERHRLTAASLCLIIAASAQEDFALIIGPVGFVLWWQQRAMTEQDGQAKRTAGWALAVGVVSFVYVLAAVLLIIPAFRSGAAVHYSRYFGDLGSSPGDLVRTTLRDPLRVLGTVCTLRTVLYVLVFSVPVGFLVFRSPLRLMAGGLTFLMLSLIQLGNSAASGTDATQGASAFSELPPVPYHHFHAPLLPVLFWAAAAGLRPRTAGRVRSQLERRGLWPSFSSERAARFACYCALFTAFTNSMMPPGAAFWSADSRTSYWKLFVPGPRAVQFQKVLTQLPLSSRVASTDYVHTRLTHFERSYDYSNYLRAVNNYQPGVPPDTEFIVIDTQHPYSTIRSPDQVPELQQTPSDWELLPDQTEGYFILLKRRKN